MNLSRHQEYRLTGSQRNSFTVDYHERRAAKYVIRFFREFVIVSRKGLAWRNDDVSDPLVSRTSQVRIGTDQRAKCLAAEVKDWLCNSLS